MKLVNTRDLQRLLDDGMDAENLFDSQEETAGPCYAIKARPEEDLIAFIIDSDEQASFSLSEMGLFETGLPYGLARQLMTCWRADGLEAAVALLKGHRRKE